MFKEPKSTNKLIRRKIRSDFISKIIIFLLATIAIISLLLMFGFIIKEAVPAIAEYGFFQIYFTAQFEPSTGHFGIWGPLLITIWTSVLALVLAWWTSVRLAFFLHYRLHYGKKVSLLIIQLLAGIPSIIFGLFASKALGVFFSSVFGVPLSNSIFTAIIMLAFMIIPTMTSLVLNQLGNLPKQSLQAAVALGHTKTFAIYKIIKKEIHGGIVIAGIVAFGRALGETMAVSLILSGGVTNPFSDGFLGLFTNAWATLGVNIAYWMGSDASSANLQGALFAAGLSLFLLIMLINIWVANKSKKQLFNNKIEYKFLFSPNKSRKQYLIYVDYLWFIIKYPFMLIRYGFRFLTNALNSGYQFCHYYLTLGLQKLFIPAKEEKSSHSEYFVMTSVHYSRLLSDWVKIILEWFSMIIVTLFIGWITLDIFIKGSTEFQFNHLFTIQKDTLGNAFMNTLLLIEITIAIALPLSLAAAIYLSEFSKKSSFSNKMIKFFLDSLGGTPSIIFGMFGMIFFLRTLHLADGEFWKVGSVWAGSLTMVLVILPTFTRSIEQTFVRVPQTLREGAYSLGAGKWETIYKIVIPAAFAGIFTGIILSVGRIVSETAPIFLTMGLTSSNSFGPGKSGQTLTSRILYYIIYSPEVPSVAEAIAYEAAMLTFLLIFVITFLVTYWKDIYNLTKQFWYYLFPPKKNLNSLISEEEVKTVKPKGVLVNV